MNRKRWFALLIAVILFIVSSGMQFASSIASMNFNEAFGLQNPFDERVIEEGSPTNKIAVIQVNGVIQDTSTGALDTGGYNHQRFLRMIEEAGSDPTVSGVILRVNSPGGGVVESAEVHDQVAEIQEEYGVPVYVSMGNMAASGGYYISASADKIVAHPATMTGSIGVITQTFDMSELAENIGIDFNTITSGEYKDIMSSTREMTEDEREIMQTMVDEMYADFVQVIVDGRELSEERVREIGDGRVYTGRQAQELGLVDDLGSLDDTIAMMKEEQNLEGAQVIEYTTGFGFTQFVGATIQNTFGNEPNVDEMVQLLREYNAPRAMYLYTE